MLDALVSVMQVDQGLQAVLAYVEVGCFYSSVAHPINGTRRDMIGSARSPLHALPCVTAMQKYAPRPDKACVTLDIWRPDLCM